MCTWRIRSLRAVTHGSWQDSTNVIVCAILVTLKPVASLQDILRSIKDHGEYFNETLQQTASLHGQGRISCPLVLIDIWKLLKSITWYFQCQSDEGASDKSLDGKFIQLQIVTRNHIKSQISYLCKEDLRSCILIIPVKCVHWLRCSSKTVPILSEVLEICSFTSRLVQPSGAPQQLILKSTSN